MVVIVGLVFDPTAFGVVPLLSEQNICISGGGGADLLGLGILDLGYRMKFT